MNITEKPVFTIRTVHERSLDNKVEVRDDMESLWVHGDEILT
jgi:hypothetical protein